MKSSLRQSLAVVIGVILFILITVLINIVADGIYSRLDLTEDKLHTLSGSTEKILGKLDTPVTIRFYFSRGNNQIPVQIKNFVGRVEDLLNEYQQASNGQIIIEKFDPEPDSEAEDSAMLDGVKGHTLGNGERFYMGMAVSCLDKTMPFPFLSPERENLLEYDLTRAISNVSQAETPTIGVMSVLPVMGEEFNPMMMRRGARSGTDPWMFIDELRKEYIVKKVPMDAREIPKDIDLLLLVHPAGISPKTEYAVDQFLMRGGKLVAMVDPVSIYAENNVAAKPEFRAMVSSNLPTLLPAWGVEYQPDKVAADMSFAKRVKTIQQQRTFPSVMEISPKGINQDSVITAKLRKLTVALAGALACDASGGLSRTVLVETTEDSCLESPEDAKSPEQSFRAFKAEGGKLSVAIKLTGKFKTAFPDGPPEATKEEELIAKESHAAECGEENAVIIIADSDMLLNDMCVRIIGLFGQKMMTPLNDNINLLQNSVDNLAGDSDLIAIRCREQASRPFEKVNAMQAEAEKKFKERILALEEELKKTEERMMALEQNKNDEQTFILSPEQQEELKNFRAKQAQVRKDLKNYRKELRRDIDNLDTRLKWFNIALVPAMVALLGIIVAIIRKRRNSAT